MAATTRASVADGAYRVGAGRPEIVHAAPSGAAVTASRRAAPGDAHPLVAREHPGDSVVVAGGGERVEPEHGRRERDRRGVAADLLEEHDDLDGPESQATEVLGKGDTGPALLEHGRPQRGVHSPAPFDDHPDRAARGEPVEEFPGAAAERFLVVGELEVHGRGGYPAFEHAQGHRYADREPDPGVEPVTDDKPAYLRHGDTEVELPVVRGTEKELGVDISKLRAQTGLVTLDYGFGNTGVVRVGDHVRRR